MHSTSANAVPIPLPPTNSSTIAIPPLRLLLPAAPPATSAPPTSRGYGNQAGTTMNPQPIRSMPPASPSTERPSEGRNMGGVRPKPIPAHPNTAGPRVACFKCQGWGHFASQCTSPRQAARPARALLVEIQETARSSISSGIASKIIPNLPI